MFMQKLKSQMKATAKRIHNRQQGKNVKNNCNQSSLSDSSTVSTNSLKNTYAILKRYALPEMWQSLLLVLGWKHVVRMVSVINITC